MLHKIFKKSSFADPAFKLTDLSFAEFVIYWSIVLTPLWWLLGIQTLYFPGIAAWLLWRGFSLDKVTRKTLPNCAYAWLAMSLAMISMAALGLADIGFPVMQAAATIITFLKGYFLIFACIALPFWHRVRLSVITRAVAWMAFGYAVTIFLQLALFFPGIWDQPIYPPLARLIPGDKLSLLVKPATFQPFFGIVFPRTSLYMPDPPIPGVCGLLCYFICIGETNPRLRQLSIIGSLSALLISQSRLAWVCFPTALLITYWFRNHQVRQGALGSMSLVSLVGALFGLTVKELLDRMLEVFTSARAESSGDRAFVVGKTLEAWQQSPWLGWGVVRGTVQWYEYSLALGSFSTYASVLYLNGVFGFAFFVVALITSLVDFWRLAVVGNPFAQRAFATLVVLYALIEGLPLSWMCVYFWFFFIWLGAILRECGKPFLPFTSWETLPQHRWSQPIDWHRFPASVLSTVVSSGYAAMNVSVPAIAYSTQPPLLLNGTAQKPFAQ